MSRNNKEKSLTLPGKWTMRELNGIIHESSTIKDIGERIDFLSRQFLGTDYRESTLIGDMDTPEVFVINLEAVDCLTFIEYIEAMRRSSSFAEFTENLKKVRYRSGKVTFVERRHFFSDWVESNSGTVEDVTAMTGGPNTICFRKRLNLRKDGTYFIPGIPHNDRVIKYIPAGAVDDSIMVRLKTGDYAGIYSDEAGLDVSHVGIIIKIEDTIYLRHAAFCTAGRKVIDEDFKTYMIKKPGLVVLRPKSSAGNSRQ